MMIFPDYFAEERKGLSYPELIRERDELISYLQDFEKKEMAGDRSDPEWHCCPSPDVRYQVYLEYLSRLCVLMSEKHNKDYVWGDRTLHDDAKDKKEV